MSAQLEVTAALAHFAATATVPRNERERARKQLATFSSKQASAIAPATGLPPHLQAVFARAYAFAAGGVPAAFAPIAAIAGDDGADAYAIGCEVAARLTAGIEPSLASCGWSDAGTVARVGAAVAALALRAPEAVVRDAIGICATEAGGTGRAMRAGAEPLIAGFAAADAREAALLAEAGFTSSPLAIEGRRGLIALMSTRWNARGLEELGRRWTWAGDAA